MTIDEFVEHLEFVVKESGIHIVHRRGVTGCSSFSHQRPERSIFDADEVHHNCAKHKTL